MKIIYFVILLLSIVLSPSGYSRDVKGDQPSARSAGQQSPPSGTSINKATPKESVPFPKDLLKTSADSQAKSDEVSQTQFWAWNNVPSAGSWGGYVCLRHNYPSDDTIFSYACDGSEGYVDFNFHADGTITPIGYDQMCVTSTGSNANLKLRSCNSSLSQKWYLYSNNNADFTLLYSANENECVTFGYTGLWYGQAYGLAYTSYGSDCTSSYSNWQVSGSVVPGHRPSNAAFTTIPASFYFPTEDATLSNLQGYAVRLGDTKYIYPATPDTQTIPANCDVATSDVVPGWTPESCREAKATCSTLYPNGVGTGDNYRYINQPMYTVEQMFNTMSDQNFNYMINGSWYDLRGANYPPEQPAVMYTEPCTRLFGWQYANGTQLSSPDDRDYDSSGEARSYLDSLVFSTLHTTYENKVNYYQVSIAENPKKYNPSNPSMDTQTLIANGAKWALSGLLIAKDGLIYPPCSSSVTTGCVPTSASPDKQAARTVVGLSYDSANQQQSMVMVVVQGGRTSGQGLNTAEAAYFLMSQYGATDVFLLDGSGSSQLVSNQTPTSGGSAVTQCSDRPDLYCTVPGDLHEGQPRLRPIGNVLGLRFATP
ncbi:phosphodiester glycosidase family protein [Budvicia diplopodorum]|uniref:phosphodiester glycosidase family protein n=1 Tax=Budvicia diplopodorum TaxID=1119056 RepID=UPI00135BFB01|nr:phosphodiester glycosidase family protein [Budvicia diplopodorum]